MNIRIAARLLMAAAIAAPAYAAEPAPDLDPVRAGWFATPGFTYVWADDVRRAGDGKGGVFGVGHHGDVASIEVAGIYASLREGAQLTGGQIALLYGPFKHTPILSNVFGIVALGAFAETSIPALNQDGSGLIGDLGLGYYLPLSERGILLRAELRHRWDYPMPPRADNEPAYFQDLVFNVGVQIPLSPAPKKPPPPKPEPPEVVPVPDDANAPPP